MRRSVRDFTAAMLAVAALIAPGAAARAQQAVLVSANVATFENGYRTSWMQGSKVFNERKERIGTIADFVLVRDLAPAAILQVGRFLEMGSHFVAVPFKSFVIEDSGRRIVLPGATREALKNFPEFRFHNGAANDSAARGFSAPLSNIARKTSGKIDRRQGQGGPFRLFDRHARS